MSKKTVISVLIMLTIAPLLAIITLMFSISADFGENFDIQSILVMYMFAMITIPLWLTYLPSIILTPIIMNRISKRTKFRRIPIVLLVALSMIIGAFVGIVVLSPFLIASKSEPNEIISWIMSGVVSGSITLTIVVLIYRVWKEPVGNTL
jgi:hypothetical protein